MDIARSLLALRRRLGNSDKAFLAALAAYALSVGLQAGSAARFVLLLAVITTGLWALVKWLRIGVRKAIWRLRNRLLVAYLFVAFVPVLLMGILIYAASWAVTSQIAVYLVATELDRRVAALERAARTLLIVPARQREGAWQRFRTGLEEFFPSVEVVVSERGAVRYRSASTIQNPPEGWGNIAGIVLRDQVLFAWAHAVHETTEVTVMAPITRRFLHSLAPGIGEVAIIEYRTERAGEQAPPRPMRLHKPLPGEAGVPGSALPPARHRFDYDFSQGANISVAIWESPPTVEGGLIAIHGRASAVIDVIFGEETRTADYITFLLIIAVLFLVVELFSLYVGVSLTRTITGAFHSLYEGTERVREGDFSHRIEVRGDDQLAVVSDSFNRMTENLERLLLVAKENERVQADLEIAREVQRQLYPKSAPTLKRLELRAQCSPARMVSGDYYDYQRLDDSHLVVALGDVAGKGISAALLMATLQSSLRAHLRACLEGKAPGLSPGSESISTSWLVSRLNDQLYADTAPEKYATFYFSVYDDETGLLRYTNAGHLPPVLLRNGRPQPLEVNGMVVGAFPFAQYGESCLQLESGDLLLVYTDGLTEPENEYGEMFGERRLLDVVVRYARSDTGRIIAAVMEAVRDWTGSPELQDDMTMLVARRL